MKKLLLLLFLLPSLSMANSGIINIEAYCMPLDKLTELVTKHNEIPMLTFVSSRLTDKQTENKYNTVMFVNSKTGSYTIVEKMEKNLYCVTSVGNKVKPYTATEEKNM